MNQSNAATAAKTPVGTRRRTIATHAAATTKEGMDAKKKGRVYRGTVCIVADRHTFV